MTLPQIKQTIDIVRKHLAAKRILDAFDTLKPLVDDVAQWEFTDRYNQVKLSYQFMLNYIKQGVMDPERDRVLNGIVDSLYTLADRCEVAASAKLSFDLFYTRHNAQVNISLAPIVEQYKRELNKTSLLTSLPPEEQDRNAIAQVHREQERLETQLFNCIWSAYPIDDDTRQAITDTLADNTLPSHAKCLINAALLLGLTKFYDEQKIALLLKTYTVSNDEAVQLRALTGAAIAMFLYKERINYSTTLGSLIRTAAEVPSFVKDLQTIFLRLIYTRNTENVSRKMTEELMPGIMKARPGMMDKLKGRNAPIDISDFEENPEWQEWLENSGLQERMEELNQLQQEGSDVFISTFSHLKSFPFFQTLSNWFLPYHSDNSVVNDTLKDDLKIMGDVIAHAPYLCNSDKYSFCLSLATIPSSQRSIMINQLNEQHEQIQELKNASLPDESKRRDRIVNQYVQDLYRFFKLFSRRNEFTSVFATDMNLLDTPLLREFLSDNATASLVAEFYFKKGFYADAIRYFNHILASSNQVDERIYQKLAFAYQNQGNIEHALENYKRYEFIKENDVWNLRHIALCHKAQGNLNEALSYYKKALALRPENVGLIMQVAHCHLALGNTEDALNLYYQVDISDNAKHKAWRPVAWCNFLLGNTEQSVKYYTRIIEQDKPTAQDFLNLGHVHLIAKDLPKAFENYRKALDASKDANEFAKDFTNDAQVLIDRGVAKDDLPLLLDAILLRE